MTALGVMVHDREKTWEVRRSNEEEAEAEAAAAAAEPSEAAAEPSQATTEAAVEVPVEPVEPVDQPAVDQPAADDEAIFFYWEVTKIGSTRAVAVPVAFGPRGFF